MHAQQRLLHHVLGLGHAAEHPVCDRERDRPQLLEQLLPRTHVANPCRQLGCLGCHPSSRLALAFEAPRSSVISTAPASPATNRGTRTGCLPPSTASSRWRIAATIARISLTGEGSSGSSSPFTVPPVRAYGNAPFLCATNRRTPTACPADSRWSVPSARSRLAGAKSRSK